MSESSTTRLLSVPEDLNRRLLKLSLPLAGTQLANIALATTDTIIMGHLGVAALAGGGLAVVWFNQIRTMAVGILTPLGNRIAEEHASYENTNSRTQQQRHASNIRDLSRVGFLLASLLGCLGALILILIGLLLPLLGQSNAVVDAAFPTMVALAPGLIPCLWFQVARQFTVGLSAPQALLNITLGSVLLNLVLDIVLAHGVGSFHGWGVVGIGLATSFVHLVTAAVFLRIIVRNPLFHPFYAWDFWKARRESVHTQIRLGLPVSLSYGAEAGMFSALAVVMGMFSAQALAAHNVAYQITFIVFQFGVGFSHGSSIVVSRLYRTQSLTAARIAGLRAMAMVAVVVGLAAAAFLLIPKVVLAPFIEATDTETLRFAITFLAIGALMEFVDTGQNVAIGALRGLGDTKSGLKASLIGYWLVGLPLALFLAFTAELGAVGIWWGLTGGLSVACSLLWAKFIRTTRDG